MTKPSMLAIVGLVLAGCASTQKPAAAPSVNLRHEADVTLGAMRARDPAIDPVLRSAFAYVVFPDTGGSGILFEQGKPTGYVRLEQPAGARVAELLVLHDVADVGQLKAGTFDLSAHGNATVFVMPHGGRTVEVSSRDQRIDYQPYSG